MAEIKFIASIDEDKLNELKKLGVIVFATEKDGFILPEIPRGKIWSYALRYADNVFGDEDRIGRMFLKVLDSNKDLQAYFWEKINVIFNKALQVDRTLNYHDASYCAEEAIDDTFVEYKDNSKAYPYRKTAKKEASR